MLRRKFKDKSFNFCRIIKQATYIRSAIFTDEILNSIITGCTYMQISTYHKNFVYVLKFEHKFLQVTNHSGLSKIPVSSE